ISTVAVSYIWAIPYNVITLSKSFSCSPLYVIPFSRIGKILLISLISGVLASSILFLNLDYWINMLLGGIVFGIVYIIVSIKYFSEIKEIFVSLKKKVYKKLRL